MDIGRDILGGPGRASYRPFSPVLRQCSAVWQASEDTSWNQNIGKDMLLPPVMQFTDSVDCMRMAVAKFLVHAEGIRIRRCTDRSGSGPRHVQGPSPLRLPSREPRPKPDGAGPRSLRERHRRRCMESRTDVMKYTPHLCLPGTIVQRTAHGGWRSARVSLPHP
jgi:hypothetical protein